MDRRKIVLSGNRQEWINTLRNTVADLLSIHSSIELFLRTDASGYRSEIKENLQKGGFLQHKLELLLNPNEEESKQLMEKVWQLNASSRFKEEETNGSRYIKIQEDIILLIKKILKTEWERVKRLE